MLSVRIMYFNLIAARGYATQIPCDFIVDYQNMIGELFVYAPYNTLVYVAYTLSNQ